jgi:5'-nucleotidase
MTCTRVLLTSDDGVDAQGLRAVRAVLVECFDSVVTVAPAGECSGFARRCTYSRPVAVIRAGGGQHPVYRLDGTPTAPVRDGQRRHRSHATMAGPRPLTGPFRG